MQAKRLFSFKTGMLITGLTALAPAGAQEIISFDFRRNSDEILTSGMEAGLYGATNWNQSAAEASGSRSDLVNNSGVATTADISWSSANTWAAGPADTLDGQVSMFKGYLDDGGSGASFTISEIPFSSYIAVLFVQSDNSGESPGSNVNYKSYNIGGNYYVGTSGGTALGAVGDTWVGEGVYSGPIEEGRNYLLVGGLTGSSLSVSGQTNSGGVRGSISGVQIIQDNLVLSYWDLNSDTAGAGGASVDGVWDASTPNWSSSAAGDAATGAWTPDGIAIFSAGSDATGTSTVSVVGTQQASAIKLEEGTLTLTGDGIEIGPGGIFVEGGSTLTVESGISGSSGLAKTGAGSLILSGTNTYTGSTNISAGTATITTIDALPATTAVSISSGASLILDLGVDATITPNITGTGTLVKNGAGTVTIDKPGVNGVLPNNIIVNEGTLDITSGGWYVDPTPNSAILTVNSGATLVLNGHHPLGGDNYGRTTLFTVNGGTGTINGDYYAMNTRLIGGTLNGDGELRSTSTAGIMTTWASPTTSVVDVRLNFFGPQYFYVADGAATTDLLINGDIVGGNSLTKYQFGTMVIAGTDSHEGATTISQGALVYNGTKTGTGTVLVEADGTLAGTGSVAGAVTVNGILSPGGDPAANLFGAGTLTLANDLILNPNSRAIFQLAESLGNIASMVIGDIPLGLDPTTEHDALEIAGSLIADGIFEVVFDPDYVPVAGDFFDLFDTEIGGITSGAYSLALPTLSPNLHWDTSLFASEGILFVAPEPGRALLSLAAVLPLLSRRRRK